MPPERLGAVLAEGRRRLTEAGTDGAGLDARLLLQHAAGLGHEQVIGEPERVLSAVTVAAYNALLARRLAHEPVSRIVGSREFYGRSFAVTPAVLDPRPDTETLVEAALTLLPIGQPQSILDLGTGSGAIIVTLLGERPLAQGMATDVSPAALAVARENAERHGVMPRLALLAASWFQGVTGRFDLIVSNPPYIPLGALAALPPEVKDFDPRTALDGGPDGCEAYRRIAAGAAAHLTERGRVLVEIGDSQGNDVRAIFAAPGFKEAGRWRDLAGRIRCLGFARQ